MAPIRIGLIGLPAITQKDGQYTATGAWGIMAHLRSIQALPEDYTIVAVANSTVESAKKAIEIHGLPTSTKAYGSPEDIADDPDVELIVVSVEVRKHAFLATPALLRKKNVFVEWPLAASEASSKELTEIAATAGVRTIVGVQARVDPLVVKAKHLLASGKIGQVVSTSVLLNGSGISSETWPENIKFYLDLKSGGNEFHIIFGHFLDSFIHVLGDFAEVKAVLKNSAKNVSLVNVKGEVVNPAYPKTTPDHIFVQGVLENGAIASLASRNSNPTVDGLRLRWIITGTDGEIEITTSDDQWQLGGNKRALRLKLRNEETQEIEFLAKDDKIEAQVPYPGANTARLYKAFAAGDTEAYATFESALKSHHLLNRILESAGWDTV